MVTIENNNAVVKGYVEIWDSVLPCSIHVHADGTYGIWIDNDLYDGVDTMAEFVEQIDDLVYDSLEDYKQDKGHILTEVFKKINWVEYAIQESECEFAFVITQFIERGWKLCEISYGERKFGFYPEIVAERNGQRQKISPDFIRAWVMEN